ncbi:MAG: thiol:disulfide interchange protein DsbD, partial [Polaribacter sp.]
MKKLFFIAAFLLAITGFAQTAEDPIIIETSVKKISDTKYDIIFSAELYKGWYLYSQYNPEDASLPLEITIKEGEAGYKLIGKATEKDTFKKYSETWEKEEIVFKDKAIITQRIQLTNKDITRIKLNFFGQVCETACINIDEPFTISLGGKSIKEVVSVTEKSKK